MQSGRRFLARQTDGAYSPVQPPEPLFVTETPSALIVQRKYGIKKGRATKRGYREAALKDQIHSAEQTPPGGISR